MGGALSRKSQCLVCFCVIGAPPYVAWYAYGLDIETASCISSISFVLFFKIIKRLDWNSRKPELPHEFVIQFFAWKYKKKFLINDATGGGV